MKIVKKIGFVLFAIAFCLSLSITSAYAQPGKARYEGNNGKHKGWVKGQHKGWRKRDSRSERRVYRGYRSGQINSSEYRRLQRRGNRLERVEYRYRRDGSLNAKERRKLNTKYTKYNGKINRARRNQ